MPFGKKLDKVKMGAIKSGNTDSEISAEESADLNCEGVRQYDAGNYVKANELFLKAANAGNASAMRNLAYCYQSGKGIEADPRKAFYWFEKAAKLGNVDAMFETGICYYNGKGTEKDCVKAFSWCKKAADNGHAGAMHWTGKFYRNGEGVIQDLNEASKWTKKAADKGFVPAEDELAGVGKGIFLAHVIGANFVKWF